MEIKIGEKVVGSIYLNIQLPIESFGNTSYATILDMIKGSNGHDQLVFDLLASKCKVGSFRRIYKDDEKICIEGAELIAS